MGQLYEQDTYTTRELYVVAHITEWDIKKAGPSILFWKGLITEKQYQWLLTLPSLERSIQVGLMQRRSKEINYGLTKGFVEARQFFFESNKIEDADVIAIKKDAIYLRNKYPTCNVIGPVEFRPKNTYTTFLMLPDRSEVYYYYDVMSSKELIDIKGISDSNLVLHEPYMIDLIKAILYSGQTETVKDTIDFIREVGKQYLSRQMDIGYYREFNNRSLFKSNYVIANQIMYLENAPNNLDLNMKDLDISYNYNILMHFYKIFTQKFYSGY